MVEVLRARRLCLSPEIVIEDGVLVLEGGRVLDAGSYGPMRRTLYGIPKDLGDVTLMPALCNAHTHLELSHCLGKTRMGEGFLPWLQSLLKNNLQDCSGEVLDRALQPLKPQGTGHLVDIGSRNPRAVARALKRAGLRATLCGEAFGFSPLPWEKPLPAAFAELEPAMLDQVAAAGHALYSTSPENLRRARSWSLGRGLFFSIHLAEFPEEEEMLRTGKGSLFDFMAGPVLPSAWKPSGLGPVAMAEKEGLLGPGTLAVHCVHTDASDRRILRESGTLVCLCPRSNSGMGVGKAPVRTLLDAGIPCCLGTDSLASSEDLNLWQELRLLMESTPLDLKEVLALTSGNVARLPGLQDLGNLTQGKPAFWTLLPEDLESLFTRPAYSCRSVCASQEKGEVQKS